MVSVTVCDDEMFKKTWTAEYLAAMTSSKRNYNRPCKNMQKGIFRHHGQLLNLESETKECEMIAQVRETMIVRVEMHALAFRCFDC